MTIRELRVLVAKRLHFRPLEVTLVSIVHNTVYNRDEEAPLTDAPAILAGLGPSKQHNILLLCNLLCGEGAQLSLLLDVAFRCFTFRRAMSSTEINTVPPKTLCLSHVNMEFLLA